MSQTPAPTTTTTPTTATAAASSRAIAWFEIPVTDLDRAQRSYEALLGRPLRREAMGPSQLAVFAYGDGATGGCLIHAPGHVPAADGVRIYLNAEPSLDAAVGRAERAGLRIDTPRVDLPGGMGAFAVVVDSEGNRIGLHALA
jgi:predicted enzyme related to lactoylglutathione lyase